VIFSILIYCCCFCVAQQMKKLYDLVRVTSQWRHNVISVRNDGRVGPQGHANHAQTITHSARVVCCYRVPFRFTAGHTKQAPTAPPSSERLYLSAQPKQAASESDWAQNVAYKFLEQYTRYLRLLGGTSLPAHAPNDPVLPVCRACRARRACRACRACRGLTLSFLDCTGSRANGVPVQTSG
jgi:hypothetical protein